MQVLVIGQHGMRLTPKEVDVPDTQQSQQDGGVLLQRCCAEVLVLKQERVVGAEQLPGREGEGAGLATCLWPVLAENTSLCTYHPVSPGEQLLEVVKSCDTEAASTEMAMPYGLLAVGTAASGTGERLDVEPEEKGPGRNWASLTRAALRAKVDLTLPHVGMRPSKPSSGKQTGLQL